MEDVVLDPFMGIGTTMMAAMVCGRHFVGYELEPNFWKYLMNSIPGVISKGSERHSDRLQKHLDFVRDKTAAGHKFKHRNRFYGFPVMTRQEIDLVFQQPIHAVPVSENSLKVTHKNLEYNFE